MSIILDCSDAWTLSPGYRSPDPNKHSSAASMRIATRSLPLAESLDGKTHVFPPAESAD